VGGLGMAQTVDTKLLKLEYGGASGDWVLLVPTVVEKRWFIAQYSTLPLAYVQPNVGALGSVMV